MYRGLRGGFQQYAQLLNRLHALFQMFVAPPIFLVNTWWSITTYGDTTLEHNEDGQRVVVQEQLRTNTSTLLSTGIVAGCSPGRGGWQATNCTNASFNANARFTR